MEELAAVFAENEEMLQHIRRGNECHRCVTPEVTTIDTLTPYINRWLYFAQIPGRERVPPGSKRWNTEDLVYDIEMEGSLPIQEVTDGGV